jgi:hypothetical protein
MDELLFDAKCKRCGSINEIDFIERFGEATIELAERWLLKEFKYGLVCHCPTCGMETIQEPVTLIKVVVDEWDLFEQNNRDYNG